MTTRQDLNRLSDAGRAAVRMAQDDLLAFLAGVSLDDREAVRDALHTIVPTLVREYGDLAATAAAEWYESVRAAQIGGSFLAQLADTFPEAGVHGGVGYALSASDPTEIPQRLLGSLQRYVLYSQRSTVAQNAQRDRARPAFARVPSGAKTCAWCTMLASRGFVYESADTAGGTSALSSDYHDDCDCQVVAEFDRDGHHIDGYDPDRMYEQYLAARSATGLSTPKPAQIAAQMRALFPDEFTDGHVH